MILFVAFWDKQLSIYAIFMQYNIFSKRMLRQETNSIESFQYDVLEEALRYKILYILKDVARAGTNTYVINKISRALLPKFISFLSRNFLGFDFTPLAWRVVI